MDGMDKVEGEWDK